MLQEWPRGEMYQTEMNAEDRQTKLQFIKAFFKEMEQRTAFLHDLFRNRHRDEALLLCCCYIEGIGNYFFYPDKGSRENFVRILKKYSGNELFWHIHPKQLQRGFADARSSRLRNLGKKLDAMFTGTERRLYSENEILKLANPVLAEDELKTLTDSLWRGTFAAIAYERIRNEAVHRLGAVDISFQDTTFRGEPVPTLEFPLLYQALQKVLKAVKEESLGSANWFGNKSIL